MSILIKGMEMPTSCRQCRLSRAEREQIRWAPCPVVVAKCDVCDGYISLNEAMNGKNPNCPLIEVPTPHGRLIEEPKAFDLDGLFYIEPHDFERIGKYFIDQVKEQPTIIEAGDGT